MTQLLYSYHWHPTTNPFHQLAPFHVVCSLEYSSLKIHVFCFPQRQKFSFKLGIRNSSWQGRQIVTRVPQHHNSTSKTLYLVAQLIHDFTAFLERSSLVYHYRRCHALPFTSHGLTLPVKLAPNTMSGKHCFKLFLGWLKSCRVGYLVLLSMATRL